MYERTSALTTAAFRDVAGAQDPSAVGSLYGVVLPDGYRDWKLISVAYEAGKINDIRAILGNEIAVQAFRKHKRPFPDGTVVVRIAWQYQPSPQNDAVFPAPQSYVAGEPTNVQVSVKDSSRYAASGGWGYGQFESGIPNRNVALIQTCSPVTPNSRSQRISCSHRIRLRRDIGSSGRRSKMIPRARVGATVSMPLDWDKSEQTWVRSLTLATSATHLQRSTFVE